MKKLLVTVVALLLVLTACFSLVGCNNANNDETPDKTDGAEQGGNDGYNFSNYIDPLTAIPVAATQTNNMVVLDSMTDGTYNYYLIDVGYIEDIYLSTLAMVEYTGIPLSYVKEMNKETSYVSSLTESVSNSITIEETKSHSVKLSAGWKKRFPKAGTFSVQASYQWNGTWTNSETTSKSTSNTFSTAEKYAVSQKISFSFGRNTDPIGKYRYALYGTCDVYFVLQTSADNSTLIEWRTHACARENDYYIRMESSDNGKFVNSSNGSINVSEDFYKLLPIPTKPTGPSGSTVSPMQFTKTVRTGTTTIYNRNNNVQDIVNFNFALSKDELVALGYSKISIALFVDIKEYRTSSDLYNGVSIADKSGTVVKDWQLKRHRGNWDTYVIEVTDLDMSRFYMGNDTFKLKLRYYCKDSNYQDWYLGTVKIEITVT